MSPLRKVSASWRMSTKLLQSKWKWGNFLSSSASRWTSRKSRSRKDVADNCNWKHKTWSIRENLRISPEENVIEYSNTYIPDVTKTWFFFLKFWIMWLKLSPHVIIASDLTACPMTTNIIPTTANFTLFNDGKMKNRIKNSVHDTCSEWIIMRTWTYNNSLRIWPYIIQTFNSPSLQ